MPLLLQSLLDGSMSPRLRFVRRYARSKQRQASLGSVCWPIGHGVSPALKCGAAMQTCCAATIRVLLPVSPRSAVCCGPEDVKDALASFRGEFDHRVSLCDSQCEACRTPRPRTTMCLQDKQSSWLLLKYALAAVGRVPSSASLPVHAARRGLLCSRAPRRALRCHAAAVDNHDVRLCSVVACAEEPCAGAPRRYSA